MFLFSFLLSPLPPPVILLLLSPCPTPPSHLHTSAGTQTGEEIPIVSRSNIKEFKDSFSNENFDFRNNPNITFFVYVSNFTWPIKIQVRLESVLIFKKCFHCRHQYQSHCSYTLQWFPVDQNSYSKKPTM